MGLTFAEKLGAFVEAFDDYVTDWPQWYADVDQWGVYYCLDCGAVDEGGRETVIILHSATCKIKALLDARKQLIIKEHS